MDNLIGSLRGRYIRCIPLSKTSAMINSSHAWNFSECTPFSTFTLANGYLKNKEKRLWWDCSTEEKYMKDFICTIFCTNYPEIAHIASTVFLHFTVHNIQFDNSFVNNVHLSKCVRWLIDLPFGILNWINYYRVQTEPKCWRRNGTTELVNCVGIHNPRHYIPPFAEANMETTWDYHEYEISLI